MKFHNLKTEGAATTVQCLYHQHLTLQRDKMQLDTCVRKRVVFYPVIIYSLDLIVFFSPNKVYLMKGLSNYHCMIYVAKRHVQKKENFSQWLF